MLREDQQFLESNLYARMKDCVKDYLTEAISNVVSAGFKFLCKSDLEENEAKEMASKNVMLNIYSVHRHAVKAILESTTLKERQNIPDAERLRHDLIIEVDNMVQNIMLNLADGYPQAPVSGGTPRMR